MFNFIKKGVSVSDRDREKTDREKERRKKDKKSRKDVKQNISGNMSSEELLRLDEVSFIRVFFFPLTSNRPFGHFWKYGRISVDVFFFLFRYFILIRSAFGLNSVAIGTYNWKISTNKYCQLSNSLLVINPIQISFYSNGIRHFRRHTHSYSYSQIYQIECSAFYTRQKQNKTKPNKKIKQTTESARNTDACVAHIKRTTKPAKMRIYKHMQNVHYVNCMQTLWIRSQILLSRDEFNR